jgi:hypothetical protein
LLTEIKLSYSIRNFLRYDLIEDVKKNKINNDNDNCTID